MEDPGVPTEPIEDFLVVVVEIGVMALGDPFVGSPLLAKSLTPVADAFDMDVAAAIGVPEDSAVPGV
jgi:hypothetical protein